MEIRDIDALLPEDVVIRWRGRDWKVPGDLAVERILSLMKAMNDLQSAGDKGEQEILAAFNRLAAEVTGVLTERQPDVQALSFGGRELILLARAIQGIANGKSEESGGSGAPRGNGEAAVAQ